MSFSQKRKPTRFWLVRMLSDDLKWLIALLYAPVVALGGWMLRVEITQRRQEDRIGRIESDVKDVKTDQHEILGKLDRLNINIVQLVEQVKTLFKESER